MTYTGHENHSIAELVRQIEHEGASRATVELLKRVDELVEYKIGFDEIGKDYSFGTATQIHEALRKNDERIEDLESELEKLRDKYDSLNELLGETA